MTPATSGVCMISGVVVALAGATALFTGTSFGWVPLVIGCLNALLGTANLDVLRRRRERD